jgi:hypothetical protein
MSDWNGLGVNMGNLSRMARSQTRSISPENFDGAKNGGGRATEGTGSGPARELGVGWKLSPSIRIAAGEVREIAAIDGPGVIQHIWMTPTGPWRNLIIRFHSDWVDTPQLAAAWKVVGAMTGA